ncbi:hypothetical protein IWW47_003859 [Coemansia sp. RSA 2052]|nr:hypothetical protein IWW47_003859 [Coemansia sp. RSA 2052]
MAHSRPVHSGFLNPQPYESRPHHSSGLGHSGPHAQSSNHVHSSSHVRHSMYEQGTLHNSGFPQASHHSNGHQGMQGSHYGGHGSGHHSGHGSGHHGGGHGGESHHGGGHSGHGGGGGHHGGGHGGGSHYGGYGGGHSHYGGGGSHYGSKHKDHGKGTGKDRHKDYSKYSKSSIFVPNDWHFQNTKAGVADLITRVAQHVDKQFTKSEYGGNHGMRYNGSMVSIAHDAHGMFKDGKGSKGHSNARARVGSKSVPTICPRCQSQILTHIKRRPDAKNVIATAGAVALSLILKVPTPLLPLALLPMQLKSLHKISHYCPKCNYKLGKNIKISIPMDDY